MIRSCKSKDRQCDAFQMVVCPFALFLLYVLLRFTPSDYPFVIIKLFLQNKGFITLPPRLGTDTSIKSGGTRLVLLAQLPLLMKCCAQHN